MTRRYRECEMVEPEVRRPCTLATGKVIEVEPFLLRSKGIKDRECSPLRMLRGYSNTTVSVDGDIWRMNPNYGIWVKLEYWEDFDPDDERNIRTGVGKSWSWAESWWRCLFWGWG